MSKEGEGERGGRGEGKRKIGREGRKKGEKREGGGRKGIERNN